MTTTRRLALNTLLALPLLCSLTLTLMPAQGHAATNGSGRALTETRNVPEFEAISLAGSVELVVRQGTQQNLQVQTDDNLLPLLETRVESTKQGNTLIVRWKKGERVYARSKVSVTVVLPRLVSVASAGNGDIRVESFNTPALQVVLSGSGDARLDGLITEELTVRISGSGNVSGQGTARKLAVNIAGSGDVALAGLRSDEVAIGIAGSGDAAVNAQKTLSVSIAGSGNVSYVGNASLSTRIAGSGSVTRK